MELSLNIQTLAGLFISLVVLAAVPSTSVLLVSSRSAVYGFTHGIAVAAGVVLADMLFISIALYGMTLLLPWIGNWELFIRLLAAGYLFWLAIWLWRQTEQQKPDLEVKQPALFKTSFMMGVLVTLADQKAILFYMGFFPAWLDLSQLSILDTGFIFLITLLAVGGVKCFYAYLAATAGQLLFSEKLHQLNKLSAVLLLALGTIVAFSLWQ